MAGIKLFTSNRLEFLVDDLAEMMRQPIVSPLQAEIVVVQSLGMARWLSLEIAMRNHICANCRFPFPNAFAHEAFKAVLPDLPEKTDCRSEVLVWKIMQSLPAHLPEEAFADLKHYLGDGLDKRKLFQLANKIAWLYDQYLIFRPDYISNWNSHLEHHWQAVLWRDIKQTLLSLPPPMVQKSFQDKVITSETLLEHLPERLFIFGISALPPFHMELFEALAQRIEVNFFLLQPCQEYWGYISSEREIGQTLRRQRKKAGDAADLYLERGNRLLASMGKLGRDFLNLLFKDDNLTPIEKFVEPEGTNLLNRIQSDILHLRDRGTAEFPKETISADDNSIQVHSCHSPMREMEALYDAMLDWFQNDPDLAPRDVLVLTPDVETYAPFIQAVFDCPEENSRRIPFSLADRSARCESQILNTFLALLNLSQSRLGFIEIFGLLETEALRRKFSLSESEVDLAREWVEKAGIRWGADPEHRVKLQLPDFSENSWRKGLERLLLGFAMGGDGKVLFHESLPFPDIESSAAQVLGHFVEFIEKLLATISTLEVERTLLEWELLLQNILNTFFERSDDSERQLETIRRTIEKLRENGQMAGYTGSIDLAVLIEILTKEFAEDPFGSGFLNGGVTFAALKPMRSLPFKIICLVGMSDNTFPRPSSHLGFDLMARKPRLGDRSSREDDRYLFFETILSAREKLYVSYVGQSIRDNSAIPPSVVVSELMDYITQGYILEASDDILRDHIVVQHRLQAFSPAYFSGGRLFSYSSENFLATQSLQKHRVAAKAFFSHSLSEPEENWRTISINDLASFFCNPCEFLLTRRVGLRLPQLEEQLLEREPFVVDSLEGYLLKQELVKARLQGHSLESLHSVVQASARLPVGQIGQTVYRNICGEVEQFVNRLLPFAPQEISDPLDVDFSLDAFRITGRIDGITPQGLLRYRCSKLKANDLLRLWIPHLVWNHLRPPGHCYTTIYVAADETRSFNPILGSGEILRELLALYWQGLTEPLKFFPQTSLAFVEAKNDQDAGNAKANPLGDAQSKWLGNSFQSASGESTNPYFALCFGNDETPLDETFKKTAQAVYTEILQHQGVRP